MPHRSSNVSWSVECWLSVYHQELASTNALSGTEMRWHWLQCAGRRPYVLSNMYVMRGIMLLTTHVLQHGGCPEWVTKREITRTSGSFLYVLRFPMFNWQLNACAIVPQMFLFFKIVSSIFFRFHLIFYEWWRKKHLAKIQFEIWRHYCVFLSTLHYGKSTILFCVFIK